MKKSVIMTMVQKDGKCVRVAGNRILLCRKKEPVAAGSKDKANK